MNVEISYKDQNKLPYQVVNKFLDSLLEPAPSGHSRNCTCIGFIFQSWRFPLGGNIAKDW